MDLSYNATQREQVRTKEVDRNEKPVWWELGASGFEGRADPSLLDLLPLPSPLSAQQQIDLSY